MNNDWTDEELRAAVDVYVEMLQKHHSNKPFTKKHYYEELHRKYGRTEKSFAYRMQNIAANVISAAVPPVMYFFIWFPFVYVAVEPEPQNPAYSRMEEDGCRICFLTLFQLRQANVRIPESDWLIRMPCTACSRSRTVRRSFSVRVPG